MSTLNLDGQIEALTMAFQILYVFQKLLDQDLRHDLLKNHKAVESPRLKFPQEVEPRIAAQASYVSQDIGLRMVNPRPRFQPSSVIHAIDANIPN